MNGLHDAQPPRTLSRRRFLHGAAAVTLMAVIAGDRSASAQLVGEINGSGLPDISEPIAPFVFSVDRALDLVQFDISFYGFATTLSGKTPALVPTHSTGVITVQLPPQAIAESAYGYTTGKWKVDPPPVLSALSGPSLLCFSTDEPVLFPTMTVDDVLDWTAWTMLVPGPADINSTVKSGFQRTPTGGQVAKPGPMTPVGEQVTYIEYPYGVFLSPTVDATASAHSGYSTTVVASDYGTPETGKNNPLWSVAVQQTTHAHNASPRVVEVAAVWASDYEAKTIAGDYDANGDVTIDYAT